MFLDFIGELKSLQKKLDTRYHVYHYFRDQLLTALDVPAIHISLRDRIPRTSKQSINRIADGWSYRCRTAGSTIVNYASHDQTSEERAEQPNTLSMYKFYQSYNGDARRNDRIPWRRTRPDRPRRASPDWLKGFKGCFVCVLDHRASQWHSPD